MTDRQQEGRPTPAQVLVCLFLNSVCVVALLAIFNEKLRFKLDHVTVFDVKAKSQLRDALVKLRAPRRVIAPIVRVTMGWHFASESPRQRTVLEGHIVMVSLVAPQRARWALGGAS